MIKKKIEVINRSGWVEVQVSVRFLGLTVYRKVIIIDALSKIDIRKLFKLIRRNYVQ